ncbi:VHS1054 protein [Vibrio phage 1]|nr:VHS1054 protein [Vibrio phage 1]
MKRITLNPQTKMKIYTTGNRKFKLGESSRFNDSTANKYLKEQIDGVPCFVEIEDKPDQPDVKEKDFGTTDQMDRNDAVKVEAPVADEDGEDGEEV